MVEIRTPRLSIAPFAPEDDLDELLEVFNSNPEFLEAAEGRRAYERRDAEEYVRAQTEREHGRCLALRTTETGELVGTAALLVPHPDGLPWIGLLILHAGRQGDGLGREASRALERVLAREGWPEVRLGVLTSNPRALGFWTSCGYEVVEERDTTDGLRCRVLAKALG